MAHLVDLVGEKDEALAPAELDELHYVCVGEAVADGVAGVDDDKCARPAEWWSDFYQQFSLF